jgi:hypothetical protein
MARSQSKAWGGVDANENPHDKERAFTHPLEIDAVVTAGLF